MLFSKYDLFLKDDDKPAQHVGAIVQLTNKIIASSFKLSEGYGAKYFITKFGMESSEDFSELETTSSEISEGPDLAPYIYRLAE